MVSMYFPPFWDATFSNYCRCRICSATKSLFVLLALQEVSGDVQCSDQLKYAILSTTVRCSLQRKTEDINGFLNDNVPVEPQMACC